MAAPINVNLEVLDTPIVEQTNFEPDMQRWLANIVDIINANFTTTANALANLIFIGQTDIGGGGAGPLSVTVAGLLSTNFVSATLVSSSNPNIVIIDVTPGSGSFTVTFNADPGASAIIAYQAYAIRPQ